MKVDIVALKMLKIVLDLINQRIIHMMNIASLKMKETSVNESDSPSILLLITLF
jgi:hypothetical protein